MQIMADLGGNSQYYNTKFVEDLCCLTTLKAPWWLPLNPVHLTSGQALVSFEYLRYGHVGCLGLIAIRTSNNFIKSKNYTNQTKCKYK